MDVKVGLNYLVGYVHGRVNSTISRLFLNKGISRKWRCADYAELGQCSFTSRCRLFLSLQSSLEQVHVIYASIFDCTV
jgi:hypothetical protein